MLSDLIAQLHSEHLVASGHADVASMETVLLKAPDAQTKCRKAGHMSGAGRTGHLPALLSFPAQAAPATREVMSKNHSAKNATAFIIYLHGSFFVQVFVSELEVEGSTDGVTKSPPARKEASSWIRAKEPRL